MIGRDQSTLTATGVGLIAACAAIGLAGCSGSEDARDGAGTEETRAAPNIVLIVIDTLRADKLGCYGYPAATSAPIDALAARGVRFERVISQCSWTRPSIGSILTSRYPRSLGIYVELGQALDDRFETLAEVLHDSGYATFGVTANPNINAVFNFHQGFDLYYDSGMVWPWMLDKAKRKARRKEPLHRAEEVFAQAVEWVRQIGSSPTSPPCSLPHPPPYYVQVNVMEVHPSFAAFTGFEPDPDAFAGHRDRDYLIAVREVAARVGQFVSALESLPGGHNTLFVITSDHGEGLSDHPDVPKAAEHGFVLYESQVMVPLILYGPSAGIPEGRVVEQRVRLLDLMPTLLDFAGVEGPAQMEGISLMPAVRGEASTLPLPELFIVETERNFQHKLGVYSRDWKYFENRAFAAGLPERSLHAVGTAENGAQTSLLDQHPEVETRLAETLASWEGRYPRAQPTPSRQTLKPEEREQLRVLGYVE